MSVQQLLQQLLQSGQSLVQGAGSKLNAPGQNLGSNFGGFGGGALAGGALGLLLGNKKFRKMGGNLAAYGGAAALGAVGLKAYQDWKNKQESSSAAGNPAPQAAAFLPPVETEQHSKVIFSAMIAAAKADGHIGAVERQHIDAEVAKLSNNPSDVSWFHAELEKPADPSQIAALATTPELAAEVYLASLVVIDEESFMERAYLDELARSLKLEPSLKTELESKLKSLSQ